MRHTLGASRPSNFAKIAGQQGYVQQSMNNILNEEGGNDTNDNPLWSHRQW